MVTENFGFWELFEKGEWEPGTFDVFDRHIDEDTVFLDIGGWIGSTALYGAELAKKVLVFEPDPKAFGELNSNVELNRELSGLNHITAYQTAIAPNSGKIRLGIRHEGGDSMSSVLLADSSDLEVESMCLAEVIKEHDLKNESLFVKMDVEGFEYDIIPSIGETIDDLDRAKFLVSLHPQFLLERLRMNLHKAKMSESKVRRLFFKRHQAIFRTFKNYKCTYVNGTPFKLKREMAKSLITGQFPREILFVRG